MSEQNVPQHWKRESNNVHYHHHHRQHQHRQSSSVIGGGAVGQSLYAKADITVTRPSAGVSNSGGGGGGGGPAIGTELTGSVVGNSGAVGTVSGGIPIVAGGVVVSGVGIGGRSGLELYSISSPSTSSSTSSSSSSLVSTTAATTGIILTKPLSSSSSLSLSTTTHLTSAIEMFPQQQQQQQNQQQIELQKLSNISKINSLAKISGLDGITQMPEAEKLRKVQQIVEAGVGDHAKQQILQILDKVSLLKPPERLLLYLRMPGGAPETDPLRQPQNPLGTRSEINHTINWVRSHLEHDPKVSIPKQDVYNDYISYCDRVDIKPLSTADFGKVMKQVFPEIRPRRLGTRGHSRYCYAAMRKATKLDAPCLPDLGTDGSAPDFNGVMDEESWKIIKMWAEGLLNSSFDTLKDLAGHITKHHLNSPASNSSRLLLQKKLLQRDAKEKRKFTETNTIKKRRKKKRRSSSSSESVQAPTLPMDESLVSVKQEITDSSHQQSQHQHHQQQQQQITHVQATVTQVQNQQQQMLPMNLVTEHDNNNMRKIQGTNLACDTNLVVGCTTKNIPAQNLSPICATKNLTTTTTIKDSTSNLAAMPQNLIKPSSAVKEEIPDDYHSNILCKKVRQAHQSKGLWNPTPNIQNTLPSQHPQALIANQHPGNPLPSYSRGDSGGSGDTLMGPPAQMEMHGDHLSSHPHSLKTALLNSNGLLAAKMGASNLHTRARKLRHLQAKLEALHQQQQEEQNALGGDGVDKDVLPENLGIPRERVISICNMDKHELDDYLNEEENSQDQEAELLQYFQPEDSEDKSNSNDHRADDTTIAQSQFPILENYQLYGNAKGEKNSSNSTDQNDQITQLRYYLHQNLQANNSNNNKDMDGQVMNKSPMGQSGGYGGGMYPGGSASASLAMMSQRHLSVLPEDPANSRSCPNTDMNNLSNAGNSSGSRYPRRKINLNARSCVPNSPTRRKNFSFVPISPNANTNNNSVDFSPFVSPRSTPVVRKPPLHKQTSLPLSEHSLADPMIGATNSSFAKSINFQNAISASAPPSPSLVHQRFRFAPNSSSMSSGPTTVLTNGNDPNFNNFHAVSGGGGGGGGGSQYRVQISNSCSLDGFGESRSQSVPLHCRNSPGFNHSNNFPGFSSACSSVAQTPVPPEFTDFSDQSLTILDMFGDTSQQHQPVKIENPNDIPNSLLDEIASNESGIGMNDLLGHDFDTKINTPQINVISRSVPSTPLPMMTHKCNKNTNNSNNNNNNNINNNNNHEAGKINKMYDLSKSVPTTPIAMNVAPFRYSPEFNRDYLINGNTVDTGKISSFYKQQQQQQHHPHHQHQHQQTQNQQSQQQPQNNSLSDSVADKVITTSLPDGIDELSNFGESIIGSDLLNNL